MYSFTGKSVSIFFRFLVVVYTGLLPITQNETALVIVVGHEIAHAIAKHDSERMSQAMVQQLGRVALQVVISQKPPDTQNLLCRLMALGAPLVLCYHGQGSRKQKPTSMG